MRTWQISLALLASSVSHASILPIVRLEPQALQAFEARAAGYDQAGGAEFIKSGRLWIDSQPVSRREALDSGEVIVESLPHGNIAGGHLHHLVGTIHVPGVNEDRVWRRMQDYSNYPNVYKPDVAEARGELLPDSTPEHAHYRVTLRLVQSTLWVFAGFDAIFDTHYTRPDQHRSQAKSRSIGIRELRDGRDPGQGAWPEGEDHGFLWRIDTWWHARERSGGVDLEIVNITLSRSVPTGFGWWTSRKARQSIENLLKRTRASLMAER